MRYKFIKWIYKRFRQKFCWADLVAWETNGESWFMVFKYYGQPKGCIIDSMQGTMTGSDDHHCYCGNWCRGHHSKSFAGQMIPRNLNQKEESEELPF